MKRKKEKTNPEVERLKLALLKIAYWTQCRYSFNVAAEALGNKTSDEIIAMGKKMGW